MCGIVGYIGNKQAAPIIVDCIEKLQYRGYDSVGEATIHDGKLLIKKDKGKLDEVNKKLNLRQLDGNIAIGHSRWATHGKPDEINAHPHTDCKQEIALIHNGIIENFSSIKKRLIEKGHRFKSET
ncbi:glutamine--fructose-6-phosphate aminotransferase, partial [Candidatus Micrarchaeota archaeon]|nr:glutamine--fructose-6-phosphate aminotransferase [Candidatus Micrarchaeota archaeon]